MSSKLTIFVLGVLLTISVSVALSTASSSTAYETSGQIHILGGENWPAEIRTVIYPTADVYAFGEYEVGYSRSQLKFDISGVPSGADITSAKLWLYRFAVDNWDGNVALNRVENQVWDETITASEFDAQTLTDEENHAGKFTSHGWDYLNVLIQLKVDYDADHTYTSFRLRWANDDGSEPSIGIDDGRFLLINSEADELFVTFCASEYDGSDPYLEVIYVPPYPVSPWPKFRRDLQNTGRSPYVGPPDNTLKWSYPTSTLLDSSPSIGPDGTIYIGGFDGKVYAVNPDGTLKWTYPTGDKIHSSPAIDNDGTIYIGSKGSVDGTFYALNPDGTLKWSHFISQVYSPPTVAPDGTIYVGSRDYKLYAFNPDGTLKWSFATGGYIYSCPAIDPDGTIYFGSYDGNLYALNPDGTLKWPYRIDSYIYSSPAIAEDGTIYVGTAPGAAYSGDLYAVNPDGTLKWKFSTGNRIYSSAAIGPDNTIYVGSDDGNLYALYDNGSLKWSYTTGHPVQSSPAVDANSDIYVGSGRDMFALNPNGTLKWKYATGSSVISPPAIDNDGTVYFGSLDGNLYAIKGTYEKSANPANPDPPPTYVYLTWATPDTAHTVNVSWRTDENYVGEVRYDNGPRGGDPGAYSYGAGGTGGLTTPELGGYIHHVELTGLEPNAIYYFICGHPDHGWSAERSFRTAPDQVTSFRFVVGGDSRDDDRYDYYSWPSARDDVSQQMAQYDPSFVLFVGDYLWSSEDPPPPGSYAEYDTWDNWLGATDLYWNTTDGLMIPGIHVIGNHEIVYPEPYDYDPETDATNYYTVFNLPENERWYSLSWGALRIIVLDGEVINEDSSTWQEQLGWLEEELQRSENYLWKMVAYHRPIFRFWEPHEQRRLEDWGFLFTKYGVDVAFQAHIHWYERSHPIDSDPPPGEIAPSPEEGVIYLTSGGWGGPLSYGDPEWYTAYGPESDYHFTLVDVFENGTLHIQAIDRWGNVFDEFFLQKDILDISISPSENEGLPGEKVTFLVTVKNTGGAADNYLLENVDNAGWILKLDNDWFYNVAPGESRTTTLTVTIPGGTTPCIEDNITVVATSQKNIEISDNATCIAHAVSPKVEFSLVTLYKISLNVNLYLENGSKLVAKFYTYGDAYENESVIENFIPPAHVVKLENVPHPGGLGIKKVRLDLTYDNTENVISTIASFTVTRSDLMKLIAKKDMRWPYASPAERSEMMAQIVAIDMQWPYAPA